jgi:hypothetical protein
MEAAMFGVLNPLILPPPIILLLWWMEFSEGMFVEEFYARIWWNVALLDWFCFYVDVLVIVIGLEFCVISLFNWFCCLLFKVDNSCFDCLFICYCSSADWKFASEQFVKELPDKVFVHCKNCASLWFIFWKVVLIIVISIICCCKKLFD